MGPPGDQGAGCGDENVGPEAHGLLTRGPSSPVRRPGQPLQELLLPQAVDLGSLERCPPGLGDSTDSDGAH